MVPLNAPSYLDNCGNSRANTCEPCADPPAPGGPRAFIRPPQPTRAGRGSPRIPLSSRDRYGDSGYILCRSRARRGGDASFECLPYQLSMAVYGTSMVTTGNGESGFDSGEGALKTATTSKEGSRHANYPMTEGRGSDEK